MSFSKLMPPPEHRVTIPSVVAPIVVNAVAPSYFPTEMTIDPRTGTVPPDHQEVMKRFTPLERLGRPGELDTAVLFLAAPASTFVTGVVLPVDGGWTAW